MFTGGTVGGRVDGAGIAGDTGGGLAGAGFACGAIGALTAPIDDTSPDDAGDETGVKGMTAADPAGAASGAALAAWAAEASGEGALAPTAGAGTTSATISIISSPFRIRFMLTPCLCLSLSL